MSHDILVKLRILQEVTEGVKTMEEIHVLAIEAQVIIRQQQKRIDELTKPKVVI